MARDATPCQFIHPATGRRTRAGMAGRARGRTKAGSRQAALTPHTTHAINSPPSVIETTSRSDDAADAQCECQSPASRGLHAGSTRIAIPGYAKSGLPPVASKTTAVAKMPRSRGAWTSQRWLSDVGAVEHEVVDVPHTVDCHYARRAAHTGRVRYVELTCGRRSMARSGRRPRR